MRRARGAGRGAPARWSWPPRRSRRSRPPARARSSRTRRPWWPCRRPRRRRRRGLPDPQPIVFPRDDGAARPPDRVVVLHRPSRRRCRRPLGLRVRGLPGRARRLPGHMGLAFRAHRRGRRHVPRTTSEARSGRRWTSRRDADGSVLVRPAGSERDRLTGPTPQASIDAGSLPAAAWAMAGDRRVDADLAAATDGGRLGIRASRRASAGLPPVLHNGNGWVDFGPAGGSYYYSRPRMDVDRRPRGRRSSPPGDRRAPGSTTSGATSSRSAAAAGTGSRSTSPTGRR